VPRKRYASILIDNRAGAHLAVDHLIACGHRDIAFVGGDIDHPSLSDRLEGYREKLQENHIPVQEQLIDVQEPDSRIANGARAMARLLQQHLTPSAVFAANDAMAIGCIQQILQSGLKIPSDIAVAGFDDIEMSSLMQPSLTTLHVFKEELGRQAVETLVGMIRNGDTMRVTKLLPVELKVRESSCAKVVPGEELVAQQSMT